MSRHGPQKRAEVFGLLVEGSSVAQVHHVTGVAESTIRKWVRMAGMHIRLGCQGGLLAIPVDLAVVEGHGGRLGYEHRVVIQQYLSAKATLTQIARLVGVAVSTISREIKRVVPHGGTYDARVAQALANTRRSRPKQAKLDTNPALRRVVVEWLNDKLSPEQVAGRLREQLPDREDMWVSHETIYQALYAQGKGSLREELLVEKALRSGRGARKPRSALPKASNRTWIGSQARITQRPAEADDRAVPGHWEGDLVLGKNNQTALITLAERSTRFVLVKRLPDLHTAPVVADALIEMMAELPEALRRTLTWDQGAEMSQHARFTLASDCQVFFCDPHSPWQRGTNENTNGLVRDYYPKGTDFTQVSDADIQAMQDQLNRRPRKTLNFATPAEKLSPLLVASTA